MYGRVIKGMDVVDAMVAEETDESDAPLERIAIEVSLVRMTREQIEAANDGAGGFALPESAAEPALRSML